MIQRPCWCSCHRDQNPNVYFQDLQICGFCFRISFGHPVEGRQFPQRTPDINIRRARIFSEIQNESKDLLSTDKFSLVSEDPSLVRQHEKLLVLEPSAGFFQYGKRTTPIRSGFFGAVFNVINQRQAHEGMG